MSWWFRPVGLLSAVALLVPFALDSTLEPSRPGPDAVVQVRIEDKVRATVDARFVSVAIDAAQVVGGLFWDPGGDVAFGFGSHRQAPMDFDRPRLRALTKALAPAYLRIGGSEADRIFYDLSATPGPAPEGFEEVLTAEQWDGVGAFAKASGLDLVFTLNAGPAARDADGAWQAAQAELLIQHTREREWPVGVWELGNEVNGYAPLFGPWARVDGEQYAADLATARALLDRIDPGARLSGPSSAFFPRIGEPFAVLPDALEAGAGAATDVIAWHYYPMQSQRCPLASRRAERTRALDPGTLDEVQRWADEVSVLRDRYAPEAPIWMGETGHAQCGGAAGLSDRFAGSFWWLDQLGTLAARGVQVAVRQTLIGSDYGLLDEATAEPRPDYWATLLFKRYMGRRLLAVTRADDARRVRTYAHCHPERGVSLMVVNLDTARGAVIERGGLPEGPARAAVLEADTITSTEVRLNGVALDSPDALRAQPGASLDGALRLGPASIAFVDFPDAGGASCPRRPRGPGSHP